MAYMTKAKAKAKAEQSSVECRAKESQKGVVQEMACETNWWEI